MSEENPLKKEDNKQTAGRVLGTPDIAANYWGAMTYITGLIKSSELKAGLILSFFGIIFNFIYESKESFDNSIDGFSYIYIVLAVWLVSTLLSMFYSVNSFIPRIEKQYDSNVFFFGDIISKFGDIDGYTSKLKETAIDKDELYKHLGEQIYINSKITAAKFKNVNKSLKYLVYSIICLIILVFDSVVRAVI